MSQPTRRQVLVDAEWKGLDTAVNGRAGLDGTRLRDVVETRVGQLVWPVADTIVIHGPTAVAQVERDKCYVLEGVVTLDVGDLAGREQLAAKVAAEASVLDDIENDLISRWLLSVGAVKHVPLSGDLWSLDGPGIGRILEALGRWRGRLDLLLAPVLYDKFKKGDPDQRAALQRLVGGTVAPAFALDPASSATGEAVFLRHGTGEHLVGLVSDMVLEWDLSGPDEIRFLLSERLSFAFDPANQWKPGYSVAWTTLS
jgi:hypothetical protein